MKVPVEQFRRARRARAIGPPGIWPLRRLREDRHPAPAQPGRFEGGPGTVVVSCHREADDRRLGAGLDIHPPVIFEGGPLTFNPTLVRVFAERLELADDDIVIPQNPETIVALGAALAADELFADNESCLVANLLDAADTLDKAAASPAPSTRGTAYFASPEERAAWKLRMRSPRKRHPTQPLVRRCAPTWVSIQAPPLPSLHSFPPMGSLSTRFTLPTRASLSTSPVRHSSHCATAIAQRVPRSTSWAWEPLAMASSCSRKPSGADYHTVETVAHARAAEACVPDAELRVGHRRAGHEGPLARWRHHHRHRRERGLLIRLRIVS